MFNILLLILLGFLYSANATTRHVPVDYPTIQAAFDALSQSDTVLVDTGVYAEALFAPSIDFVLRGNVASDTGDYPRPVIDPSSLSNPRGRTCLRMDSGHVVIEEMAFRNRLPMYPHTGDTTGGIHHPHGTITLQRCVFDSTFNAVWAYWADVVARECVFRHLSGIGIRTTRSVEATDCEFHSNMVLWAQLSGWGHSRVERCHFSGDYGTQSILILSGDSVQVRDCIFGPGVATAGERFYFLCTNSVFENNVIENWSVGQGIFVLQMLAPGSLFVRNNIMRNCATPLFYPPEVSLYGFDLSQTNTCDTCVVEFDNNVIDNCTGFHGVPGLVIGNGYGHRNRFTQISPVAVASHSSQCMLRDNLIYGNAIGLTSDSGAATDARWNWWGDSTGPSCPQNPDGLGDEIQGDVMLFDPWYTDTTFFPNAVSDPTTSLPSEYSLAVYPNPFNPVATLRFDLTRPADVRLDVFNVTGQHVRELANQRYDAGQHAVTFDAGELPSGIYFVRLDAAPLSPPVNGGRWTQTEKLVLMK